MIIYNIPLSSDNALSNWLTKGNNQTKQKIIADVVLLFSITEKSNL